MFGLVGVLALPEIALIFCTVHDTGLFRTCAEHRIDNIETFFLLLIRV